MKKNKNILFLVIILVAFLFVKAVKADFYTHETYPTCQSGKYATSVGSTPHDYFCKLYDTSGNIVYCLEIEKEVSGGTLYTYQTTLEGKGQACGVLKAMNDGLISTPTSDGTHYYKTVASDDTFYKIQKIIWDYENTSETCSKVTSTPSTTTKDLPVAKFNVSSKNISMSIKDIGGVYYYVGKISLSISNITNYTITNNNSNLVVSTTENGSNITSSSSNILYARIPVSKVTANSTYQLSFSTSYDSKSTKTTTTTTTITPFIQKFFHSSNRQLLGVIGLKRATASTTSTKTTKDTASDTINLTATLPTPTLKLQKVDIQGNKIDGAVVKITKDNKFFKEVTVSNGSLNITTGLTYGKYCVTELTPPSGYIKTNISDCVVLSATNPDGVITITNKKTSLSFLKVDTATEKPLSGATLQILDKDKKVILNADGKPKYEWISTTEKHVIEGLPVGTYYLKETSSPKEYSLNNELIKFSLNEDGSVNVENNSDPITVIIMKNKKTETQFSKVDATTGKELPGATLQILDKDKKEIKDKDGKVLYKWVSTDKPYIIEGLPVGTYFLKEIIQPKGYELNEELVAFEVKSDDEVTKVVMKNTPVVEVPDTASRQSILLISTGTLFGIIGIGLITYTIIKRKNSKN